MVGNSSVVKQGDDVTLKCLVQSNPPHTSIVWTKGVSLTIETLLTITDTNRLLLEEIPFEA